MTLDKLTLDALLGIINFLMVGGIKNAALWLHVVIEDKMTVVLAGTLSAALVALVTIYGQGQALTLPDFIHWLVVFMGSLGVYQSLITGAKANAAAMTQAVAALPAPPVTNVTNITAPSAKEIAAAILAEPAQKDFSAPLVADVKAPH